MKKKKLALRKLEYPLREITDLDDRIFCAYDARRECQEECAAYEISNGSKYENHKCKRGNFIIKREKKK